jgi:hypothetical protein
MDTATTQELQVLLLLSGAEAIAVEVVAVEDSRAVFEFEGRG